MERMEIRLLNPARETIRTFLVKSQKGFNGMLEELKEHGKIFEVITNNQRGFGGGNIYRLVYILPIGSGIKVPEGTKTTAPALQKEIDSNL